MEANLAGAAILRLLFRQSIRVIRFDSPTLASIRVIRFDSPTLASIRVIRFDSPTLASIRVIRSNSPDSRSVLLLRVLFFSREITKPSRDSLPISENSRESAGIFLRFNSPTFVSIRLIRVLFFSFALWFSFARSNSSRVNEI
jgi:hypothetical protein